LIVIRKYPNRRLYDTTTSRYVNLVDIRALVLGQIDFRVEDSKSGNDLTKSILLQIISELETSKEQSLLTETVLRQLICFYGSGEQALFRHYLETMLTAFNERRDSLQSVFQVFMEFNAPAVKLGKSFREQFDAWTGWVFDNKNRPQDK
jgi:polyhydroxyalkanoate synthesis repressor PhaR